ncbi:MAG: 2-hydroxyacyl-CoA dehydratase family protein [Chloroflexi bacterium]|nr:2-hydroxyacyl-CoA dehydratase family protein [Chloroflexota bacterium]
MGNTQKSTKRLATARELQQIVAEFYLEGHEAKRTGKPVGWMPPMNGLIEIFYAMDLMPVFPENWSPVCAAFGLIDKNYQAAESMGFSPDLCGYLRNCVGYINGMMGTEGVPLGGLPEPDMIFMPGAGCVPTMKNFQYIARRFPGAKVFLGDPPPVPIQRYHIDYAVHEIKRIIAFLTEVTGRKMDYDRLGEVVRLSDQACALWDEITGYRRCIPTPISAAEVGLMFVMVTRQGTRTAVDYLARVRDEVKERAEKGAGIIAEEKVRLFWDNIPLWYNLGLFNYFEKYGGVVVAETYSAAWSIRLDVDNPLEALAMKSLMSYPMVSCVSMKRRKEMVLRACRDYHIDGVILHSNKSCLPITLGQMDIKRALHEELGVPSVVIEADHMDPANFSMAQFEARVDAFMEVLLQRKGSGRR